MVYFNNVLTDFLQMTFPSWKNTTQYKLDIFYRARCWATPVFKSIFVGPSCHAKVRITCGNICRIEALSSYFSFLLPQHHDEWIPTEAWGNAQLTHLPPETLSQHHWKIRWWSRWICSLVGRSRCMWHIATPVPFVLLPLPLPGLFVLARGVASIHSLLCIRSLLPIFLHNARKKAPHDRRHDWGLKRPIPDKRDKQIPHEARGNAQLMPNLSLDGSWQGINPQARQWDNSPIGLGPTVEFQMSWNHCRGCIMDNRAMTPNETVSFR